MSLFSSNGFNSAATAVVNRKSRLANSPHEIVAEIPDVIPVSSSTDWSAAFGFSNSVDSHDDDLGFDPWDESTKALADMIEKEATNQTTNLFSTNVPHNFPSHFGVHSTAAHTAPQIHHPQMQQTTAPPPGLHHPHSTTSAPPQNKCLPPGFSHTHLTHNAPVYNGHIINPQPGKSSERLSDLRFQILIILLFHQ